MAVPFRSGETRVLLSLGSTLLVSTTGGGLYRSDDNGETWLDSNTGLPETIRHGAHLYVGTELDGMKIAYNVDAKTWIGQTSGSTLVTAWTSANTGLTNLNVQSILPFDNRVFIGTKGGVFVSANEGRNWAVANTGLTNQDIVTLAANTTHLFAATTGGVFASANRGQSWTAANAGLSDLNIQAFAVNGANLFAGTASGVFHSPDNGQSWRALNDSLSERNVTALLVSGATV
ncbi:MAG: hypothetical protein HOP19_00380, partial [Acidobacteria bacterium]|nr:hypothetical protein [Acidobacteriota bacterium]